MAFVQDSFIAYRTGAAIKAANARTCRFWHYATNDDWATVGATGYWNNARAHIGVGDIVHISGDLDGTPFYRSLMFATVPASGNVTVTQLANS
ncbi:hypothetical protein [Ancylobacter sp. IITR112]|uniref:hypothetical protein n=1 Tax=Ancylobacter sp. IITR112 TaxID=3138073 RepID=UPI00352BA186